jgi:hypothetical protein
MRHWRNVTKSVNEYVLKAETASGASLANIAVVNADREISAHSSEANVDSDMALSDVYISDIEMIVGASESSDFESEDPGGVEPMIDSKVGDNGSSLRTDLASWACDSTASRKDVNDLLTLLRKHGASDLPADARTLLKTPRSVNVVDKCGGKFCYFGLYDGIHSYCTQHSVDRVQLLINIDGLPLFHSSSVQLWPILCGVVTQDKPRCEPFLVALYCGTCKPSPLEDYLHEFINELSSFSDGLVVDHRSCTVEVKAFICDAPARAWLKCVKCHTGYNSCERCVLHGSYESGRVTMTDVSAPLRNDDLFAKFSYRGHQESISPLNNIPNVGLVSNFILDYMHLICLGVVRRLLHRWTRGPKKFGRLSSGLIAVISEQLISLRNSVPSDFARKPRSLKELDRWKATEFRMFLLYVGPVVLKKHLHPSVYENFLCLSVGTSILLSDNRHPMIEYARQLLICFVNTATALYGDTFVVYNVHSLIHIADDVRQHGCSLNHLSAFPFENYLQKLKKLIRSAHNPVAQIARRLHEMNGRTVAEVAVAGSAKVPTLLSPKDNCYLLTNGNLCFIKEVHENGQLGVQIVDCCRLRNWFSLPCESSKINIFYVTGSELKRLKQNSICSVDLKTKMVHLQTENCHVFLPILHQD